MRDRNRKREKDRGVGARERDLHRREKEQNEKQRGTRSSVHGLGNFKSWPAHVCFQRVLKGLNNNGDV